MKNILFGTILLSMAFAFFVPREARANGRISISSPPVIVFSGDPELVVLPGTYIYVVPDSDVEIFFYDGWWWRPWGGRWYRSHSYSSGWGYYKSVPSFYIDIPSGWRNDYREHHWKGQQWDYQRIPHQQVQANWSNWEKSKHWEKQNAWGVHSSPQPHSRAAQPARAVQPDREARPDRKAQPSHDGQQYQRGRQSHEGQRSGPNKSGGKKDQREHR